MRPESGWSNGVQKQRLRRVGGRGGGSWDCRGGRGYERPPCTDFDVAYFQSYSHVGIHEEMIKVS